jgi:hypothetical protein
MLCSQTSGYARVVYAERVSNGEKSGDGADHHQMDADSAELKRE